MLKRYIDLLFIHPSEHPLNFTHSAVTAHSGCCSHAAKLCVPWQGGWMPAYLSQYLICLLCQRESRQGKKESIVMKRKKQGRMARGICWPSTNGWISRVKRAFQEIKQQNNSFSPEMTKFLWINHICCVQPKAFKSYESDWKNPWDFFS